jgi:hypothetical protein
MSKLQKELETYNRLLPGLIAHQGKFVLIKGDENAGMFDSYQDALDAGYAKYQLAPFLVRQILPAQNIAYFTRDIACPA